MTLFEKYFTHQLQQEDMTTATGGVWGSGASIGQPTPFSSDFYAPGDSRNMFGTKPTTLPKKKRKKGKKRKKSKKLGEGPLIPMQRRNMVKGGL